MSSVLLLIGSPSRISRSSALAKAIGQQLTERGVDVSFASLRDIPAEDLIAGRWDGEPAKVDALVVSTPVYKASFSGALKALLDLLPERALADKIVLPIATGGTLAHLLAVEYALKPVLSALGARHILGGVFATESQVRLSSDALNYGEFDAEVSSRIGQSVEHLAELLAFANARKHTATGTKAPQVRCSA
jgi:FMN reductase